MPQHSTMPHRKKSRAPTEEFDVEFGLFRHLPSPRHQKYQTESEKKTQSISASNRQATQLAVSFSLRDTKSGTFAFCKPANSSAVPHMTTVFCWKFTVGQFKNLLISAAYPARRGNAAP